MSTEKRENSPDASSCHQFTPEAAHDRPALRSVDQKELNDCHVGQVSSSEGRDNRKRPHTWSSTKDVNEDCHGRDRSIPRPRKRRRKRRPRYREDATANASSRGNIRCHRAKERRVERSSSFHEDAIGHYEGGTGAVIANQYRIVREVGVGTFGRVLDCVDLSWRRSPSRGVRSESGDYRVAIKVIRNVKRYCESALIEARIISEVNRQGGRGRSHCVIMHDAFWFLDHYCLVFERLGPSLYDFLRTHDFRPFPSVCVQDFAVQLLEALEFLHRLRLIHTDLKIENILLVNGREVQFGNQMVPESTRIKIIDFGGACFDNDSKSGIISTRQYRAPEVILDLGWSMPSDMWSLGCILAELYQGDPLFTTHDNVEHLALIERIVGQFPVHIIRRAKSNKDDDLADRVFDSRGRHRLERVLPKESFYFVRNSPTLDAIVRDDRDFWFKGLLERIVVIDPLERSTAHECLLYLSRIRRDVVRFG